MIVGVLKEGNGEKRVSVLPEHITLYTQKNIQVVVEQDAGINSFASNELYSSKGARILSKDEVISEADVLLCINSSEVSSSIKKSK